MKRILYTCLAVVALAVCATTNTQAQAVSVTVFTAKVNQLDSLIGVGAMTSATSTWNDINDLMMLELGATKSNIMSATTTATRAAAQSVNDNQYVIYNQAWALKSNLATNRTSLRAALLNFASTF